MKEVTEWNGKPRYMWCWDCGNYTYKELCENHTLLDGTELWMEE